MVPETEEATLCLSIKIAGNEVAQTSHDGPEMAGQLCRGRHWFKFIPDTRLGVASSLPNGFCEP